MNNLTFGPDTAPDGALRAQLIHATGVELFDLLYLGREKSLALIAELSTKPDTMFGTELSTMAYRDGHVAGMELGFAEADRDALEKQTGRYLHKLLTQDEFTAFLEATEILEPFIESCDPNGYYLQNLSIVPEFRGQGIGEQLLERAFATATTEGYSTVELDVSIDNPAQHLYRRVGMEQTAERRHEEYEAKYGLKGQFHMVKTLG